MVKVDRLPSGSYRARVLDYTDPDGKAHYRSFTGKNKKAVQLEAAQWEAEKTSSGRRKDNITVVEAMEKCVEVKKMCFLLKHTTHTKDTSATILMILKKSRYMS